jgi:hypothetical protein
MSLHVWYEDTRYVNPGVSLPLEAVRFQAPVLELDVQRSAPLR